MTSKRIYRESRSNLSRVTWRAGSGTEERVEDAELANDAAHDEYDHQLAGTQMPAAVEQGEKYLDGQEEDEEQNEGGRRARAQADARPVDDVYRVGQDQRNAQRRERADYQAPGRNRPPIGVRQIAHFVWRTVKEARRLEPPVEPNFALLPRLCRDRATVPAP